MMPLYIYVCLRIKYFFACIRTKFPELRMEKDLNNFNIGFKIEFGIIGTPHILIIKLVSGIQKCNDKSFTNTLDLINLV